MKRYQTVVIGLGAMGSAAVYQLSKRSGFASSPTPAVLGIDRYAPPHALGSTHGESRVTRQAIGEGAAYTPLALRSHEIWRELESRSGEHLLGAVGMLIMSKADSDAPMHGRADFLAQTLDSARRYGIDHEMLDSAEIARRFPQFKVRGFEQGYLERGAGYVRPDKCVAAQLDLARAQGAEIHTGETALGFDPTPGGGVRVRTDRGEYEADHLILSAGAWLPDFLGAEHQPQFKVYRQLQYWFAVEEAERFAPGRFPVFIWDLGLSNGFGIYGFPALGGASGGIKLAKEDYSATTTPAAVNRTVTEGETRRMYEEWVRPHIAGVRPECLRASACLYTVTTDSDFVIDRLPGWPRVIVASPCSGHGFKHSAAVGEILAEMATRGESRLDISAFRWGRLGTPPAPAP